MPRPFRLSCLVLALLPVVLRAAEPTWTYAVQVHATVQADPPRVTLHWPHDGQPATRYSIWRKGLGEDVWIYLGSLPGHAGSFTDEGVATGRRYEYQVEKEALHHSGWGYAAVGINAPLLESRGKVVLVVDNTVSGPLASDLRRLERDLAGDGWGVVRKEVGRNDSPDSVRAQIRSEWDADRANVRAVFLFGRVPVPRAGQVNIDGHGARSVPADVYYAEMDGDWSDANGDGVLDQGSLPSDVELQVGRVDFADMPGANAAAPFPGEIDLLRRYLDKDHAYRHARVRPPARALMGNALGDFRGQAFAASGYRNFAALVGPENIVDAATDLDAPPGARWISWLTTSDFLWAYGCGPGSHTSLGGLGTHGQYNDVWSSDLVEFRARATFYMLFGSWILEWDKPDNLLRAALAAPDHGLAAVWSGRPHYYFHSMAVGEPIGHGMRLSQNNHGLLYRTEVQRHPRSVHIALLGDPTLPLRTVAPPGNVQAAGSGGQVVVTWSPSPDPILGYRIYRSASPGAPFERISGELHSGTRIVDRPPDAASATYMVRAVTLQLGPGGSYYHASQGAFSRPDFVVPDRAPAPLAPDGSGGRIAGAGREVASGVRHLNGNIYDQILIEGNYVAASPQPGRILRMSFIDPDDDIVQIEMSGRGTVAVLFDQSFGPAAPSKYHQPVAYMKGRPLIAVSGADASTHLSIFSVGRSNAANPDLFRPEPYDGIADIALLTLTSTDGRFGGLRLANTRFSATKGLTGVYASDMQVEGPLLIGDIDAQGSAQPIIHLGAAGTDSDRANEVRIAGGDLAQSNGRPLAISGVSLLLMDSGSDSHGGSRPAQFNHARVERNGEDVTGRIVVNP